MIPPLMPQSDDHCYMYDMTNGSIEFGDTRHPSQVDVKPTRGPHGSFDFDNCFYGVISPLLHDAPDPQQ